jgi:hypothetical protein
MREVLPSEMQVALKGRLCELKSTTPETNPHYRPQR